MYKNTIYTVSQ